VLSSPSSLRSWPFLERISRRYIGSEKLSSCTSVALSGEKLLMRRPGPCHRRRDVAARISSARRRRRQFCQLSLHVSSVASSGVTNVGGCRSRGQLSPGAAGGGRETTPTKYFKTTKIVYDESLMNVPKVADRNKLLLFWLQTFPLRSILPVYPHP